MSCANSCFFLLSYQNQMFQLLQNNNQLVFPSTKKIYNLRSYTSTNKSVRTGSYSTSRLKIIALPESNHRGVHVSEYDFIAAPNHSLFSLTCRWSQATPHKQRSFWSQCSQREIPERISRWVCVKSHKTFRGATPGSPFTSLSFWSAWASLKICLTTYVLQPRAEAENGP